MARVTAKGQVTIPKKIRRRLGIKAGDELEFVEDREGVRIRKRVQESPFHAYRGYLCELAGHDPDEIVREMRGL